jgi:alkylation response protein AidB-like acyl-CoA dehydrogenase
MNVYEQARSLLRQWQQSKPTNFYDDDGYLRAALAIRLGAEGLGKAEPGLRKAGADSAGPINRICSLVERPECLPRLEPWSDIGERTEEVVFHPAYHEMGRLVWGSGIVTVLGEPGTATLHSALTYLFGLNGESPHLCAVGCTAGLVKAIQRCGSEWMRRDWLPRLLDSHYDRRWHAGQFLTEVQGGSDVGANACLARRVPGQPDAWRITGEKWFCSNVSADLCAVTARPEGASAGTAGLGLFVVPRRVDDGRPNRMFTRRLKNKLGTRALATAEVEFQEALAYQLGSLEEGFKVMLGVIINTSRLGVGVLSSAMMRRAYVEAVSYARVRTAFGRRLIEFPAIRYQLAEMSALATAGLAFSLSVAALEDQLTRAGLHPEDDPLFRSAVNINKYVCSTDARRVIHHAIEVLGGNGTIEDFSVLPRLYREMPVHEMWEGPHNTLMAQLARDAVRSKMLGAFVDRARDLLLRRRDPALLAARDRGLTLLEETDHKLAGVLREDLEVAALHLRGLIGRLARVFQAALLLEDAEHEAALPLRPSLLARAHFLLDGVSLREEPAADARSHEMIRAMLE